MTIPKTTKDDDDEDEEVEEEEEDDDDHEHAIVSPTAAVVNTTDNATPTFSVAHTIVRNGRSRIWIILEIA